MAEVLVEFAEPVFDNAGATYAARACGTEAADGLWQGWIEFVPGDGGPVLRSGRETTQPNRQDAVYWATGLTPVYLEGALHRALTPRVPAPASPAASPAYQGPAPATSLPPAPNGILNPYSVYQKGEALLRRQLAAFSTWHLVNIIRAYELSSLPADELAALTAPELIDLIVADVKRDSGVRARK